MEKTVLICTEYTSISARNIKPFLIFVEKGFLMFGALLFPLPRDF